MGFKRSKYLEPLPPEPSSEGFAKVLEAVRQESDADSFLGQLSVVLKSQGFAEEAMKVLQYPSIFCPCDYHHRNVPRETRTP